MVKRQKEKQYQSAREYKDYSQLRSGTAGSAAAGGTVQKKLPFHCCALTLMPFTDPVCILPSPSSSSLSTTSTSSSVSNVVLFDNASLMEFILKYKNRNPIDGKSMTMNDIVTLHMDKDDEGRWQCPILTKPFSDHTKIVAVLCNNNNQKKKKNREAYVYSYEAYKELNVKAKNYIDLTTGDKFSPKTDVLILNDPNDAVDEQKDISQFWHIQNGRSIIHNNNSSNSNDKNNNNQTGGSSSNNKSNISNVQHSVTATRIMEQINKNKKMKEEEENNKKKKKKREDEDDGGNNNNNKKKIKIYSDDVTGVQYTSGKTTGSFTSTTMNISSSHQQREASLEEILKSQFQVMRRMKEKGYVRLVTNLGDILLELHCDIVPRTCTNFLGLCEHKKYNTTIFHRLIPKFMIQGGGSSSNKTIIVNKEEESLWGDPFKDEFDDRLKHVGPGIVSMANSGPHTNKQQFFITFKSCPHLDMKHTVFGKVIDGLDILNQMEKIHTNKKDRPIHEIQIIDTDIISNPAKDAEEKEIQRIQEKRRRRLSQQQQQQQQPRKSGSSNSSGGAVTKKAAAVSSSSTSKSKDSSSSSMIGKYLPKTVLESSQNNNNNGTDDAVDDGGTTGVGNLIVPPPKSKISSLPKTTQNKKSNKQPKKQTFGDFSGW